MSELSTPNTEAVWGNAQGRGRSHLFIGPHEFNGYMSADTYRRTFYPRSACGTAWAKTWPPAAPTRRHCGSCERIGGVA